MMKRLLLLPPGRATRLMSAYCIAAKRSSGNVADRHNMVALRIGLEDPYAVRPDPSRAEKHHCRDAGHSAAPHRSSRSKCRAGWAAAMAFMEPPPLDGLIVERCQIAAAARSRRGDQPRLD